jgi:uncharacterized RDD family membrane protein YckC
MAVETPSAPVVPPNGYSSLAGNVIAGFWQRFFAFLIDSIVVSIVCFTLAEVFRSYFMNSPTVASVVGLAVVVAYFGIFGSMIVDGQTLGMMALNLKVVSRSGSAISASRSISRYLVLFVPLLGANLLPSGTPFAIAEVYESILAAAATAIVYLAIFNRRTGQSLHDLAMNTFVVDAPGAGAVHVERFWRPHWVFILGLLVLSYGLMKVVPRTSGTFSELISIQNSVQRIANLGSVNVELKFSGKRSGIVVGAACDQLSPDHSKAAEMIAAAILAGDANAAERDYIAVNCVKTLSLGFFKTTSYDPVTHTPEEWKAIIQNSTN